MSNDAALLQAESIMDGSDSTAGGGNKLTWDAYKNNNQIFSNLMNIRGFTLILDISPIPELATREVASKLATEMYGIVLKAIQEAGFFKEDVLSLSSEPSVAGVTYRDDRYDFAVRVAHGSQENREATLSIVRTGSRFEDFHSWYTAIAGQFPEMVKGILHQLRQITTRDISAFRGTFQFRFLLHDFISGDAEEDTRNWDIMGKVLHGVPGDDGALTGDRQVMRTAGRLDVSLSRWVPVDDRWRLERYLVEAPANKNGAGLWLQFSYGGETHTTTDEKRSRFDAEPFVNEGGFAYVRFLRDKALNRFLTSLLKDMSFRSSTDNLP